MKNPLTQLYRKIADYVLNTKGEIKDALSPSFDPERRMFLCGGAVATAIGLCTLACGNEKKEKQQNGTLSDFIHDLPNIPSSKKPGTLSVELSYKEAVEAGLDKKFDIKEGPPLTLTYTENTNTDERSITLTKKIKHLPEELIVYRVLYKGDNVEEISYLERHHSEGYSFRYKKNQVNEKGEKYDERSVWRFDGKKPEKSEIVHEREVNEAKELVPMLYNLLLGLELKQKNKGGDKEQQRPFSPYLQKPFYIQPEKPEKKIFV